MNRKIAKEAMQANMCPILPITKDVQLKASNCFPFARSAKFYLKRISKVVEGIEKCVLLHVASRQVK